MKISEYKWNDAIFNVRPPKEYLQNKLVGLYWAKVLRRLNSNIWNVKTAMVEVADNFGYTYGNLMYQQRVYVSIIKHWMRSYNIVQKITIANKKIT